MLAIEIDVERLREVCERYGVVRLDVFGSLSRGTGRPDSDIDLLYTLAPGARLGWAIEDLSEELAAVLGRPVDLVSRRALNSRIRDQVLAEAQPFYDAA
ncbi:MAG: nucleotidyltransferase family protein [Propionibacteriaceae bacterium]|jgi:predicted nucleotidyltransferase